MRLGATLDVSSDDPVEVARAYVQAGYAAAVCPPLSLDQPERVQATRQAFAQHDITLAEVGVWNNMLDPDPARREVNIQDNAQALALADEVGALCCVNIAGSFSATSWDGPHPRNLSAEAFELTVQNVQRILDAVRPRRARYTLEPMPWTIPDSVDVYLDLIQAINRPMFGVHLDPVNMINCPARYYANGAFLRDCFARLGRWIISCHGKDVILRQRLTMRLDEVRPGLGALDYGVFLRELHRLPGDVPLLLEHLPQDEYPAARQYVLDVAQQIGLALRPGKQSPRAP